MIEPESANHSRDIQSKESSEYICLRHYTGDDTARRYKVTDKARNISLAQLISHIDVMFEGYLRKNCESDQFANWQR